MAASTGSSGALHAFFSRCPEMLFIAGTDGNVREFSDLLRRTLGPAIEQGTSFAALVHPDDRAAVEAAWARLAEGTEQVEFIARFGDARGDYRALTCSACQSAERDAIHGSLRPGVSGANALPEKTALKAKLLDALADHLPVCVWAVDMNGTFIYHEGAGLARGGLKPNQFLGLSIFDVYAGHSALNFTRQAMGGEPAHTVDEVHGVHWESWVIPVRDTDRDVEMVLGVTLDVTKAKLAEEEVRRKLLQIENQQQVIRNLSTPIIEVWSGVLTLPMVGVVDSVRTAEVMDSLLSRVVETQARFAILDLTGVDVVDTRVASHLIELVTAIKLLGAEGIVAGIKPNVAQTMVALGLDLTKIITQRNLRASLSYCIRRMSAEEQAATG